jgi:hypothetical protein
VAIENGDDLAGNLACGEVALQAQLGGEAELAVDGATDLRGDADGGAAPVFGVVSLLACRRPRRRRLPGIQTVSAVSTVWTRACNGSDSARFRRRIERPSGDLGTADLPAFSGQFPAQIQRGKVVISGNLANILTIHASAI